MALTKLRTRALAKAFKFIKRTASAGISGSGRREEFRGVLSGGKHQIGNTRKYTAKHYKSYYVGNDTGSPAARSKAKKDFRTFVMRSAQKVRRPFAARDRFLREIDARDAGKTIG